MLRGVRLILANSAASAEPYRVYSREKVKVVNNFVDLEGFDLSRIQPRLRDECGIPAEAPVIGYLGRVVPKKGLDVLITAFARLHPRFPEARLVLVGDNDGGVLRDLRAQYQALARELGVGDRVIFTGFRPDIRPYVADFDVLALPSTEPESFGRVLIEAMALRVPSVITAHGGAIEVVSHGVNGLWTTPGDPFELSEALATMLKDPDLRQRMGRSGEGIARSRYGADELSRKITDLVRSEGMPPPTSRTEARTRAALR
jgi:glycosyltransferase involved in cell wall biosynthesis